MTLFLMQSLEIGDSWSKDLCVYLQASTYCFILNFTIGIYNVKKKQLIKSLLEKPPIS